MHSEGMVYCCMLRTSRPLCLRSKPLPTIGLGTFNAVYKYLFEWQRKRCLGAEDRL